MARTSAGAQLTAEFGRRMNRLNRSTLRDMTELWGLWRVGEWESFTQFATAAATLARARYGEAADLAVDYYRAFRLAEGASGIATPRRGSAPTRAELVGKLEAASLSKTVEALRAGQSPQAARQAGLTRASGVMTRESIAGANDALLESAKADPEAGARSPGRGGKWQRVTNSGDPCAFCAMLAGRGPVYSEETADFEAHWHCNCTAEVAYPGTGLPEQAKEYDRIYKRAVDSARASGELERKTSNDLLNAFRREYERGTAAP